MTNSLPVAGIIAYPITPFTAEGVDLDRLKALVATLVEDGADAIAPLGSTGESAYLSFEEWAVVVDATIEATAGRVPVVVGCSELTTAGTIRRAEYARAAGAAAIMVLPISYWPLTEDEIFQHYLAISDAVEIPIMVYNNPATSGIDMSPELLVRMFTSIANVAMVKESTGDISRMHELARLSDNKLPFYNGSNPLVVEAVLAGASGWCTAALCLLPGPVVDLYRAADRGDEAAATALYAELAPFLRFIVTKGLPGAVKGGLGLLGRPAGVPRRPLLPLDADDLAELDLMLNRSYSRA